MRRYLWVGCVTAGLAALLAGCGGGGTPCYKQTPFVSRIVPNLGPAAGGQVVQIVGGKFANRQKLQVSWNTVILDCTLVDDSHINVVVPALRAGRTAPDSVEVRVLANDLESDTPVFYTYAP